MELFPTELLKSKFRNILLIATVIMPTIISFIPGKTHISGKEKKNDSMAILTILILPIHEHGIFLHLLVSSLISFSFVSSWFLWFLWCKRALFTKLLSDLNAEIYGSFSSILCFLLTSYLAFSHLLCSRCYYYRNTKTHAPYSANHVSKENKQYKVKNVKCKRLSVEE